MDSVVASEVTYQQLPANWSFSTFSTIGKVFFFLSRCSTRGTVSTLNPMKHFGVRIVGLRRGVAHVVACLR